VPTRAGLTTIILLVRAFTAVAIASGFVTLAIEKAARSRAPTRRRAGDGRTFVIRLVIHESCIRQASSRNTYARADHRSGLFCRAGPMRAAIHSLLTISVDAPLPLYFPCY